MSDWSELIEAAQQAQAQAYAPYSQYQVGSALLSEGKIHAGCNVENASYGATICAERHAIGSMIKAGGRRIEKLVVVTPSEGPKPPCGVCRQALAEFHPLGDFEVLSVGSTGEQHRQLFSQLHPQGFGPGDLL
jgi:cytidine deaminase